MLQDQYGPQYIYLFILFIQFINPHTWLSEFFCTITVYRYYGGTIFNPEWRRNRLSFFLLPDLPSTILCYFTENARLLQIKNDLISNSYNKSAQSNLGRGPRRAAVGHVRRKVPIGYNGAPHICSQSTLPVDRSPNPIICLNINVGVYEKLAKSNDSSTKTQMHAANCCPWCADSRCRRRRAACIFMNVYATEQCSPPRRSPVPKLLFADLL